MERITIHIKDKEKAQLLLKLLEALDFVESIECGEEETQDTENKYPLWSQPIKYDAPFDPVADVEWGVLS